MSGGELVSPCKCKGSNQYVHLECLAKWQYQAILSQSTHPSYQTGIEKRCNICQSEFTIKQHSREHLVLTFTGSEMANMIQCGCLLIATEKSSSHNLRLMEQYAEMDPSLVENLSHWTRSVFLITAIFKSRDATKESILGLNLTNPMDFDDVQRRMPPQYLGFMEKSGVSVVQSPHFIGGPVEPRDPILLFSLKTSSLPPGNEDRTKSLPGLSRVVIFHEMDVSLWMLLDVTTLPQIMLAIADAVLLETRIFWGYAAWDRVQLLGEAARGAWGLAMADFDAWEKRSNECWGASVKRAIVAGKNDFSEKYDV